MIKSIIGFFGFLYFLKLFKDFFFLIYNYFFGAQRDLVALYGRNSYALVTGASEGIGRQFAIELAKKGFNVIIIARNQEKLNEAEKAIKKAAPKAKVIQVVFDFAKVDEVKDFDFEKAFNLDLSKIDVSMLVNNVGVSGGMKFYESSIEGIQDLIKVNCLTQSLLSAYFMKRFVKREPRSCIVNLSSGLAITPISFATIYGASKRFNYHLSESMNGYYSKVDIYCYQPGLVETAMTGKLKKNFNFVTPEEAVQNALKSVGGFRHTFRGHWKHELAGLFFELIPVALLNKFIK